MTSSKKQPQKEVKMQKPTKKVEAVFSNDSFNPFTSTLDIPEPIKAYGEKKGLEFHWLDSKKVYDTQGYHPRGWKVFQLPEEIQLPSDTLKFGRDPEGVVRRGTVLLGYKSKEDYKKHRDWLDQRAATVAGRDDQRAEELKEKARRANLDAVVHEGYEENE